MPEGKIVLSSGTSGNIELHNFQTEIYENGSNSIKDEKRRHEDGILTTYAFFIKKH
jgi:hypothetical protein